MPRAQKERNLWRGYEIEALLDIMHEHNIVDRMRHKKYRSEQIYRFIQNQMMTKGFTKKDYRQIWTKWKCLKSLYVTTRRRNSIPGNKFKKCEYYDLLDRILGNVPEIIEATTFFGNIKIKNNIETNIGNNTKLIIPSSSISLQQQMSENNENSCLLDEVVVKQEPVEYESEAAMYEFKEVKDYLPLPKLKLISEMKRQTYKQQQTKNLELNLQNHLHNNNNNNITQKLENRSLLLRRMSSVSPSSSTNTLASQPKKRNSCELPKKLECNENSYSNTATKSNNNDDNSLSTKLSRKKHSKRKDYYLRAVKHLGKDLRKIQKSFIKDFFEQQNEIMRKQHEFQRKQDQLFLEHFDAQTKDLVQTVKNILSSSTNTNTPIVYIDD